MGEEPRGEEAIKRNGFGDLSVVVLDLESATPVKLESEVSNNNNNNNSNGVERSELDVVPPPLMPCDHKHYSHRSPWLRAMVLGANDGLISVASLMLGVGAVNNDVKSMVVSGLAGLVAGACSMAIGEFVSVFSQRDSELADVEKERQPMFLEGRAPRKKGKREDVLEKLASILTEREHMKGPEAQARELEELTQIYVGRGLSYSLAKKVAEELTMGDALKAHARDELGIDMDDLSNPMQAAVASAVAFSLGAAIPLLAGSFIVRTKYRIISIVLTSTMALAGFGAIGAKLGGASMTKAAMRVLIGGWIAMLITYGVLRLCNLIGV